jgi:hypothetical protein
MTTQHVFKYNGYKTEGERQLEGVMFEVHITETDTDFAVDRVSNPSEGVGGYLARFDEDWLSQIRSEIRQRVEEDLTHLREYAKSRGATIIQEFDEWEAENADVNEGVGRIDLLGEI